MNDLNPFEVLQALLASQITLGEPRVGGPLSLVPVFGGKGAPSYMLGADAIEKGLLKIGEMDGGNVPKLAVENAAPLPVLLIDGEHLQGAMQNRVLNTSVLVDAHSTTVIPVSCVEAHRWGYETSGPMQAELDTVYPRLRRMKAESVVANARSGRGFSADQGEVWREIEVKRGEMNAGPSATSAMRDIYAARRGDLDRVIQAFTELEPRQTGVIAFVAGHPVVADIFDKHETLRALWSRLISGYALDAIGHRTRTPDAFSARGFLAELANGGCEVSIHDGVGIGEDLAMTNEHVVSHGLAWQNSIVHLAVFSKVRSKGRERRNTQRDSRIDSPTRRGGRREWFNASS